MALDTHPEISLTVNSFPHDIHAKDQNVEEEYFERSATTGNCKHF